MEWARVPGGAGGGRLGVIEDPQGRWIGQVRVMREKSTTVWKTELLFHTGYRKQSAGTERSYGEAEKAGLRWLNDELLAWADLQSRVKLCRIGPWKYDDSEVRAPELSRSLVKVEPGRRPWWRKVVDLLFGPPTR